MPNSTPDHKTDHREEALRHLAGGNALDASVHSNLAIAAELKGIREALAEVIDPTAGSFPGVLRVRTEASDG